VTTLGKLANNLKGRSNKLDLSELRCFVIDECDVFFSESKNLTALRELYSKYIKVLPQKVQNIFFSATFTDDVKRTISEFTEEANQIELKKEAL
jgi:superfamily II DNA/RNA helicase